MVQKEKIVKTFIEDEMKNSYLTYAMSVIVSRALPDVRDGLKPVHRRILYDMNELGLTHDKPFKKSARVVGDVLGKYHPHGDQAVYNSLVRMAQEFSLRHPLIEGQGNFGSIDGDDPAAMRYTEVRLQEIAEVMLADIEKNTVEWVPNFDDTLEEPSVLPAAIPNLLINGSSGIAVGMATNIPPHNLRETVKAIITVIEKPDVSIKELMGILPGPDFPTGGMIIGRSGIEDAYKTGNGGIKIRAKVSIEGIKGGKDALIVNEIPYQVNKTRLIQEIARLNKEKRIDGITDLRDESDRDGIRIVVELKRGINPRVIMNQLFKLTTLEVTFGINLLALDGLRPKVMNIKQMMELYVAHRENVVERRTRFDLDKAEKRAHILEGFLKALDQIDEIIKLIRASKTPAEAQERLIDRFKFTKPQAEAILDMKLARLTGLEREKINNEYDELQKRIAGLKEILKNKKNILRQVVKELEEILKKFANERRTTIIKEEKEVDLKDLILEEDVVVTISHNGYIKRTPITAFKQQGRGGVGVNTSSLKEDDFIEQMFVASTHDTLLFITNMGKAYSQTVHEIINVGRNSKGHSISLLLSLGEEEKIAASVALRDDEKEKYIVFTTKKGFIKKTKLSEFKNVRKSGIIAISLAKDDSVIEAIVTDGSHEILITTTMGHALRLKERTVRDMGRNARGVTGIKLQGGDFVCGVTKVMKSTDLLVVTEKGYGKRIALENFTVHGRGTRGQIYIKINEKIGRSVGILSISKGDAFVIITERGMVIRMWVKTVSVLGRSAVGVKLVNIKEPDSVAAVARIVKE
ncbi:MAG TPA: DNA gyrase subunit A [Spirochaetota bacterium]|nr:DNA gyrase subunit A [Spirochaetota bacterium]